MQWTLFLFALANLWALAASPPASKSSPNPPHYRMIPLGVGGGRLNNSGQVLEIRRDNGEMGRVLIWQDGTSNEIKPLGDRVVEVSYFSDDGRVVVGSFRTDKEERDPESGDMSPVDHKFAYDTLTHKLIDLTDTEGHKHFFSSGMDAHVRMADETPDGQVSIIDHGRRIPIGPQSVLGSGGPVDAKDELADMIQVEIGGNAVSRIRLRSKAHSVLIAAPAGFNDAYLRSMNSKGVILGMAVQETKKGDITRAFVWHDGTHKLLPSLGGNHVEPYSINDSGIAVGSASRPGETYEIHAVLWWSDGNIYPLDQLVSLQKGEELDGAFKINDHGWILAELITPGKSQAVLLIPEESGGH